MNSSDKVRVYIDGAQKKAAGIGVLGVLVTVALGFVSAHRPGANGWQAFLQSYILAFVFWMAIPLGCLALLMVHHLTGGQWGLPIRRLLEAGSRTFPLMFILFIPVLLGVSRLYVWAQPEMMAADPLPEFKQRYLTPGFFTVRSIVYFAIWILLAFLLNKWSREQDQTGDARIAGRMSALSGPGLVIWAVVGSLAVVDWVMSLEPHWFSTIYGMIFMVIELLAAMSFCVVNLRRLSEYEPLKDCVEPKVYNDLGNLMLAFTMLWTYMSFSQFLIIWAGNLKDEIPWYMVRAFGKWAGIAVVLLLFHFFFPFFLLLQRGIKRRLRTLGMVAGWMLVVTLVDIYWLVAPSYEQAAPQFRLLDVAAVIGIGGVWVAAFMGQLKKMPLLPLHDPRFAGVMEHQHGD